MGYGVAFLFILLLPALLSVWALLAFFRSSTVTRDLKLIIGTIIGLGLLVLLVAWVVLPFIKRPVDSSPQLTITNPVLITIRQLGLLPYPLGMGTIERARRDTLRQLIITGIMPTGGTLRVCYNPRPGALLSDTLYASSVTINGLTMRNAHGQAIYSQYLSPWQDSSRVRGHFLCVLPGGVPLTGEFGSTPIVEHSELTVP